MSDEDIKEIKELAAWAKLTIDQKLTFGLDEAQAVYRREMRARGVLRSIIDICDSWLEIESEQKG